MSFQLRTDVRLPPIVDISGTGLFSNHGPTIHGFADGFGIGGVLDRTGRSPLTPEVFEAAKRACAAPEAYIQMLNGEQSIGFHGGVAPDFQARKSQVDCLAKHLKGSGVRFIVTLTEPPLD